MTRHDEARRAEATHRRTTITWLLGAVLVVGAGYDLFYSLTVPQYVERALPVFLTRSGVILLLMAAARADWAGAAAVVTVLAMPLAVVFRLGTPLSPQPLRTLSYLVLDLAIASIFFGERGVAAVTALNVAVVFVGGARSGLDPDTMIGVALVSVVMGGLLIAGLRHRQRVERSRQDALAANEALRAAVVDTALDPIVAMDIHGTVLEFNPAAERTFGRRRTEVVGRPLADVLIPERLRGAHRAGLERYRATGEGRVQGQRLEMPALRADGTEFPCELVIGVPQSGDPVFIGYLRDLTERDRAAARQAQLEAQLRDSQKMQAVGQLAGGIAHDFNNTLQAVGGHLFFALDQARDTAPALAADLESAIGVCQRASGFVKQLLTFSRRQPLQLKATSLNALITEVMPLVQRAAGAGVAVVPHLGQALPAVHVDAAQIHQVVLNLCLNARDAMPGGGTLTVETEEVTVSEAFAAEHPWARAGRFGSLVVADTGLGMTPDVRERMFEPFFSTKGPERGTGLGLAMVYGIVEQHQGFIRVDSAPGQGTAIRIYLPLSESAPESEDRHGVEALTGTETILVADDADAIRHLTERLLKRAGYTVVTAANGVEAVERFARAPDAVHLALLDVMMPRGSGREAFTAMRKIRPDLPVVFVTGYTDESLDAAWLEAMGVSLVTKPVPAPELLRVVRAALDRQP
ncbi:MAG: ATP-binding protein [Vicinamibacterales bacterium]